MATQNRHQMFVHTVIADRLRTSPLAYSDSSMSVSSVNLLGWSTLHFHHKLSDWVVIFYLRQPMAFLSLSLYYTPGLAPRMNVLFWEPGDFPVRYSNRLPRGTLEIVIQEVLWSIRPTIHGSYSAILSLPLTNVKWHSQRWPTVTC